MSKSTATIQVMRHTKENTMNMRDEILQEDGGLEVVHIIDPFMER